MNKPIFLVLGSTGQVGWEIVRSLQCAGVVVAADRRLVNLLSADSIRTFIDQVKPNVIINAAAYTAVDKAEVDSDQAFAINRDAVDIIGNSARKISASVIHYSTDYVFDGSGNAAWKESDSPNPVSTYGRSKLEGELALEASGAAHLTLRTSWVYAARASNFLLTMLRASRQRETLRVVDDQFGAPTWARSIAQATADVIAKANRSGSITEALAVNGGVFHLAASGVTTWHDYAKAIFTRIPDPDRIMKTLEAIPTSDYPTPAVRPANSRLDCNRIAKTWGIHMPQWDQALDLCCEEIKLQG